MDLFEPSLRVKQGGNNKLILHATTPTPNSCYSAGEASIQDTPRDRFGIPEARYVTLPLRYSDGPCAQAITSVHHRLSILYQPGKNLISATTTLDGKELGSATIRLPKPDDNSEEREIIDIGDVTAWVDAQPPEDQTLYVEATVTVPHTGHSVTLDASDNAHQEDEYHLDLGVTESDEPPLPVVRKRSVRFEQSGVNPELVVIHTSQDSTVTTEVMKTV